MNAKLNKEEKSLLIYLECCAVDFGGRCDARRMNDEDFSKLEEWERSGFIKYGRIASKHCNRQGRYWVQLSAKAIKLAAQERKERAARMWKNRNWMTTAELKNE